MERTRMPILEAIAIVLLAAGSLGIDRENDPSGSIQGRTGAAPGAADEAIRGIFHTISSGKSTQEDDDRLVDLVKDEIVRTAQSIKTPTGSIDAAARRAQRLVTELTAAYTTLIYKSKTSAEARTNFFRFQNAVQRIVDFIKRGQFMI